MSVGGVEEENTAIRLQILSFPIKINVNIPVL